MITDMKDAKIFQPLQLGRTTLKNRIAMAPMSMHYEALTELYQNSWQTSSSVVQKAAQDT